MGKIEEFLIEVNRLNMLQAIHKVVEGHSITSCIGKTYNKDMLQPKWYGEHYASFRTNGMTKEEQKGEWKCESQ